LECKLEDNSGWKQNNNYWTQSGLSVNSKYYFRAKARNGDASETPYCASYNRYTLANLPAAPTVNNPTLTSLDVTINPNGNPSSTECTIIGHDYGTSSYFYLDASGDHSVSPVWQTITAWGTVTATKLTTGTNYQFWVAARNGDGIGTGWGPGTYTQTLPRTITVTVPNGGEEWYVGGPKTITWTSQGVTGNVKIEISRDGGSTWSTITSSTANDGSYTWTVTTPASMNCRVRVTSLSHTGVSDISNANFEIAQPGDPCEGDFDGDGDVDGTDLAIFAAHFGRTDCGTGPPCEGDFPPADGDVDGSDMAIFAADFGRTECP